MIPPGYRYYYLPFDRRSSRGRGPLLVGGGPIFLFFLLETSKTGENLRSYLEWAVFREVSEISGLVRVAPEPVFLWLD